MNVNFLGEAIAGRGRSRAAPAAISRGAAMARDRSGVGQNLHALLADFAAGPRAHRRRAVRPAGAAVPHGATGFVHARRTAHSRAEVRLPGHGGIPRQGPDRRGVHAHAGPPGLERRRAPASRCRPTFRTRFGTLLRVAGVGAASAWRRAARRITIRLVKGANMEMERVEASMRGWPQAPFKTKRETDANYKRMLHEAMKPENLAAVRRRRGVAQSVRPRLRRWCWRTSASALTGCSSRCSKAWRITSAARCSSSRAICCSTRRPAARRISSTPSATSIRRLDENTGPENFLRHAFKLKVGSPEWQQLEDGFLRCVRRDRRRQRCAAAHAGPSTQPPAESAAVAPRLAAFRERAGHGFALPQNGEWARADHRTLAAAAWRDGREIPLVIGGEEMLDGRADARMP